MSKMKMCNRPGCSNLITLIGKSYCNIHEKKVNKEYNKNRPDYSKLYHDVKWRKLRIEFLKENPLCCYCKKNGIIKAALVVDHIIDHRGDLKLMWNIENLQALCKSCHNSKTMKTKKNKY